MTEKKNYKPKYPRIHRKDERGVVRSYDRFFDEEGIALYCRRYKDKRNVEDRDRERPVYVEVNGKMLGIGMHNSYEDVVSWIKGLEGDVASEIERIFNASLSNPKLLANTEQAFVLGREAEAKAHNRPVLKAYERLRERRNANESYLTEMLLAKRKIEIALIEMEEKFAKKQAIRNVFVQDESLILRLFDKHDITVHGQARIWLRGHLHELVFNEEWECWNYLYVGTDSKNNRFFNCLQNLAAVLNVVAPKTKEEKNQAILALDKQMDKWIDELRIKAECDQAIVDAEEKIINKKTMKNVFVHGESLLLRLFMDHEIEIYHLAVKKFVREEVERIQYNKKTHQWEGVFNVRMRSRTFPALLQKLVLAVEEVGLVTRMIDA